MSGMARQNQPLTPGGASNRGSRRRMRLLGSEGFRCRVVFIHCHELRIEVVGVGKPVEAETAVQVGRAGWGALGIAGNWDWLDLRAGGTSGMDDARGEFQMRGARAYAFTAIRDATGICGRRGKPRPAPTWPAYPNLDS